MSPCLRALEELQRAGKSIAVGITMLPWGFGSFFSTETHWLARLVYASMNRTRPAARANELPSRVAASSLIFPDVRTPRGGFLPP